jgi:hypothetical protein
MIRRLTAFFTGVYRNPAGHALLLAIYYLAIIAGLVLMYGRGDFVPHAFIYQGF